MPPLRPESGVLGFRYTGWRPGAFSRFFGVRHLRTAPRGVRRRYEGTWRYCPYCEAELLSPTCLQRVIGFARVRRILVRFRRWNDEAFAAVRQAVLGAFRNIATTDWRPQEAELLGIGGAVRRQTTELWVSRRMAELKMLRGYKGLTPPLGKPFGGLPVMGGPQ